MDRKTEVFTIINHLSSKLSDAVKDLNNCRFRDHVPTNAIAENKGAFRRVKAYVEDLTNYYQELDELGG